MNEIEIPERVFLAIRSRHRAGDTPAELAHDYGYSMTTIERILTADDRQADAIAKRGIADLAKRFERAARDHAPRLPRPMVILCFLWLAGCTDAHLEWDRNPDAGAYRIYRSTDEDRCRERRPLDGPPIAVVTEPVFDDRVWFRRGVCYELESLSIGDIASAERSPRAAKGMDLAAGLP